MISLRILTRNVSPQLAAAASQRLHTSKILFDSNGADAESSDDEKRKENITKPKNSAEEGKSVHRLNSLLQAMSTGSKDKSKVNIAVNPRKPIKANPRKFQSTGSGETNQLFVNKLAGAAKEVATSLGGDVKKTESELLKKILTSNAGDRKSVDISQLVLGMKIDRTKSIDSHTPSTRAHEVRTAMQRTSRYAPNQQQFNQRKMRDINQAQNIPISHGVSIDSGTPLNIFTMESEAVSDPNTPTLSTWDLLERKEHKLLVTHPPINFIEQQIRWTEQGRLWRFPINNEQDMNIGQEEHFSEHIFLEQHLEGWCPTKGPIRHFMELVCVGLSKNPWVSAKDKRARIMWFKDYFDSKRDLLQELGAFGKLPNDSDKKQIQA